MDGNWTYTKQKINHKAGVEITLLSSVSHSIEIFIVKHIDQRSILESGPLFTWTAVD